MLAVKTDVFIRVLARLEEERPLEKAPVIALMAAQGKTPFCILIAAVLSARTRDEVTAAAAKRLFARADSPRALLGLSARRIERLIYPVGFYRDKARRIRGIAKELLERCDGRVPSRIEALLEFEGVGRKTANLVLSRAFGIPAVCVDTHVHRIANRLGYVRTRTPEQTESAIRATLPRKYWSRVNTVFVAFGQTICRPANPRCDDCPVRTDCAFFQSR